MPTRSQEIEPSPSPKKPAHISGMTHDGVGAGVDDFVPSFCLNADGRLEKLVHGLGPGRDADADKEHAYPTAQAHQGKSDH